MTTRWLAVVCLFGLIGCRPQDASSDLPGYQFAIPADVPARYVVVGKDGERFEVDGHAEYAWGHRPGGTPGGKSPSARGDASAA